LWAAGPARLGYGGDGEITIVSFGPNANQRYITTYFRKTFTVADPAAFNGLLLRLMRDDGAVVEEDPQHDTQGVEDGEHGGGHAEAAETRVQGVSLKDEGCGHLRVCRRKDDATSPHRQ
jgi:hypothetical protein